MLLAALAWIAPPAIAAAQTPAVGSGPWAMPSLHRVLVATETETGVDVAAMAGYGVTEDVLGSSDTHHRVGGSLALAGRPLSWLTIAGRVDGRWDHHLLGGADDQSAVGEARLSLRGDWALGSGVALGLASIVFVPGSDAPSLVFDATTVDVRGLASWTPEGAPVTLALDLGARFDRSARAVGQRPLPFGRPDLVSLGASDSDAVLLGAGIVGRIDESELFGEITADLLVEHGLAASPVRVALGARVPLVSRLLSFHAALEAGLGGRIPVDGITLVPIEPRLAVVIGLVLAPRSTPAAPVEDEVVEPDPTTASERRGRVLDPSGTPIAGARVHPVGATDPSATTDSEGDFVLSGVSPDTSLEVEAEGYVARPLTAEGDVVLERALPEGALRGLVRSLSGRGITATIHVDPSDAEARADADGVFELALPPGHYRLTIEAHGYTTQHREVDVELGGVTVLNVDLRGAH